MLIVNDEHRLRAGMKSLSKRCSYCSKPLKEYPLIMNDDAGFHVFHAACAAALAIDIQVDLCTFFNPPAPYPQLFVLTAPGEQAQTEGDNHAISTYSPDEGGTGRSGVRLRERGCPVPLGPSLRSDAARASFWL
jgi:hypothetical protein